MIDKIDNADVIVIGGMRLRANPHRGRVYKEKVRAKKKLIDVSCFCF